MRIRSKTYETHGLQDPARFTQGTSRASYTHAHQKTNSSLLLAVKSFKAGWQPGLPSSLLPPPYATGPPKRRALLQTGSFVCYTVACARNTLHVSWSVRPLSNDSFPAGYVELIVHQEPWLPGLESSNRVPRPRSDGDLTTMDKHAARLESWVATTLENESIRSKRKWVRVHLFFRTRFIVVHTIVEHGKTRKHRSDSLLFLLFSFFVYSLCDW